MAAIFQLRRGSGSVSSLSDGELYLNKSSGSLQVSLGDGNPITLARLDQPNSGSLYLGGNITASNAYFSGDVAISGNLYLGNETTDKITATGEFTSDLIPNPSNTYSLGSSNKLWKSIYATSITGAIAATNGVVSGSAQMVGILSSLNTYTSSNDTLNSLQTTRIDQLATASGSAIDRLNNLETTSASVNTTNTTQNNRLSRLEESTASLNSFSASNANTSLNSYTASNDTTNTTQNNRLSRLEESTASLNSYSASLKTAMTIQGSDVTLNGNLTVQGTTTQINSTQVNIGDNIIELNFGGSSTTAGIYTKDATGTSTSGSLLWDASTDKWIAGQKGSEAKVLTDGLGVVSGSAQISIVGTSDYASLFGGIASATSSLNAYTSSANLKLARIEESTASLNTFSASVNEHISDINTKTGSFESKFTTLQSYTASIDSKFTTLQTLTASYNSSIGFINAFTASNGNTSLNEYTSSQNTKNSTLESYTASLDTKNLTLENVTSSLNLATASFNTWTGSTFNTFSTSVDSRLDEVEYMVTVLDPGNIGDALLGINAFTASSNIRLNNLEATTASLNSSVSQINAFTASSNIRLNNIEGFTSSIDTTIKTKLNVENVVSSSTQVLGILSSLNTFTASNDNTSLNSYTASLKNAITISGTDVSVAGNLTVLGTTTVIDTTTLAIKDNIIELNAGGGVNGGLVVRDVTGTTTSGSLLWDTANDYWVAGPLGAESKLLRAGGDGVISSSAQVSSLFEEKASATHTLVSGSSQISYVALSNIPSGIISSSAQIDSLFNIDGLVSGSSQINFTQLSGISSGIVSSSTQVTPLLPTGTVSGSSQINFTQLSGISNGIVSSSAQVAPLLPTGTISGSIQILGGSTIHSGSDGNYQFNSIGVGTAASTTAGEIRASGDITAYYSSDIRLKENIVPISNALEKVNQISGNTYDWKEGFDSVHSHKGNDVGVIAQEIEAILPQIVTNRDTGFKAVQYEKIVPLLIEAIKELSAKVDRLENK